MKMQCLRPRSGAPEFFAEELFLNPEAIHINYPHDIFHDTREAALNVNDRFGLNVLFIPDISLSITGH